MLEAALVTRLQPLAPNLYPLVAPKNYATPAVVYNRLQTGVIPTLATGGYEHGPGGSTYAWVHEQVDVYETDYDAAVLLAQAIRQNLSAWSDDDVLAVVWNAEEHMVDETTDTILYRVALRMILLAKV